MKQTIQQYLKLPSTWKIEENVKHAIMPNAADIKNAEKSNPQGCALRNTACRVFDIPNAAIGGRCAYIPQRDSKGKYYIARMRATALTMRAIEAFDKTGEMPKGGFTFVPLTKSDRFMNKRTYMKKWTAGKVGGNGKSPINKPRNRKIHARKMSTRTIPMNVRAA
jgi:hypothetical protein